jgi:hypothetical protein
MIVVATLGCKARNASELRADEAAPAAAAPSAGDDALTPLWTLDDEAINTPESVYHGGGNDLYVAITRATQRLNVLHASPLPPGLEQG